jgi:hypothetical protein
MAGRARGRLDGLDVTSAAYRLPVRHARDDDLDRLEDLLARLRQVGPLVERKRGNFQHRSRAFLHFHADGDDLYADVRLDGVDFARRRVTGAAEQAGLVAEIEAAVSGR